MPYSKSSQSRKRGSSQTYSGATKKYRSSKTYSKVTKKDSKKAVSRTCVYTDVSGSLYRTIAQAAQQTYTYRGNGCYDPDVAIGGHQPMGFDQMMQLYKRFYVAGSSIQVDFAGQYQTNAVFVCLWADLQEYVPVFSALQDCVEICKTNGGLMKFVIGSEGGVQLHQYRSTRSMFGSKDDDQTGSVAGDPNKAWYWHVVLWNPYAGTASCCNVNSVKYYCQFDEMGLVTSS